MTTEEYEDILYNHRILRWSARILGTIEVALLFYLTFIEFKEEIANHSPSPFSTLINGQYFLAATLMIAFIGLIIVLEGRPGRRDLPGQFHRVIHRMVRFPCEFHPWHDTGFSPFNIILFL
jgi:hypothetical protein